MSAHAQSVSLTKISAREAERLRPADPDRVVMIASSMRERGQLQPIGVYRAPNKGKGSTPWVLAFGLHRLKAAELLGWEDVAAKEVTVHEARLVEIEENLCRADLTVLDKAIAVNERRRLHEEKHGGIKRGKTETSKSDNLSLWSDELDGIAEQVGLSRRSLQRADLIGRNISPAMRKALRATPAADNQAMLMKIAKMPPEQHEAFLHGLRSGADALGALRTAAGSPVTDNRSAKDRLFGRVRDGWHQLSRAQQDALLREIGVERLRRFLVEELADEA